MEVFVINLPEDTARREATEQQLRELGLSYEIFPAINGKCLPPEERAGCYNETKFIRNMGWPAGGGELGCALSHIGIYRLVRERSIPHALILEDDVWLNPNLPQILQAIEQKFSPGEGNLFLLGRANTVSTKKYETLWSRYRIDEVRSALGTYSYVVSNAAALALLNALYPVRNVADCWGWLRRHRIVNILAVTPPCITLDMSYESSTLVDLSARTAKRPTLRQLTYKFYRAWWLAVDYAEALIHRIGRGRAGK